MLNDEYKKGSCMKNENIVQAKSFLFALQIIKLYKQLVKEKEFIISKQLLRSGTSIGANIEEAQASPSKKDFAFKIGISLKEARETRYWLKLLAESSLSQVDITDYLQNIEELIKLMTSIVKTSAKRKSF